MALATDVGEGMIEVRAPAPRKLVKPAGIIGDGDIMLFQREIGQIDFVENQTRKLDIKQMPNLIKQLMIHVEVKVVTTTTTITPSIDSAWDMISNIQLRTSQGLVLKNFSGIQIALLDNYECKTPLLNTIPAALDGPATYIFHFDIIIPFDDWTNILTERTILNTNQYNDMTLYITWADLATIWPGWVDDTDLVDHVYCNIVSLERPPINRAEELLPRQQMLDSVARTAWDTNEFILPENTDIKTLMLITRNAAGLRVNTMLDYLTVNYDSGNYVLRYLNATTIQSQNKSYYNVEMIYPGVYIIEFDQTHDFKTLFSTVNRNYAKAIWTNGVLEEGTFEIFRRRIATPTIITE